MTDRVSQVLVTGLGRKDRDLADVIQAFRARTERAEFGNCVHIPCAFWNK